ncbi:lysophospholipid acyltransferase family protein [Campylobacter sputorum]|uniref:lysophospholipid acyltransferase family protein n=1 Tax=Campylobacter sputorum TaxID=206 RepID=UPI001F38D586|nr:MULTISPECIES: lysophospholipid acyltransferase family protein [Campylobacter]ASM39884.1 1-acylglycerol-3-phosphate O-acyltransferase [Campylobacter sputorum]
MKLWLKIRAFIYSVEFILSVLLVILLMAIFRKHNHKIRTLWAKFQLAFIGIKIDFHGKFDNSANMILMNHQSLLDIIVLESMYPGNLSWIAKKEIGEIPIIGLILKLPKMIPIDRKNPRSIVQLLKDVKDRLDDERVIAIFPEGTRGRGQKLLKFQTGAKVLTQKLNLKVQPVVLVNTRKILDSKDFTLSKGVIKVIALDMIDTSDENWLEKTRIKMQECLDKNR